MTHAIRHGWKFASKKGKADKKYWMTFFTPTYQRGNTINRVYNSLINMDVPRGGEFEWIVVNDGSTDDTERKIKLWCEEDKIPIRYYYQANQGKHVAENFAVAHSDSFAFMCCDSDDVFLPSMLKVFYEEWMKIPDKENYKGITCRTLDPCTDITNGDKLPQSPFDTTPMDLRFKYKIKGEMCGFTRLDLMKKYPFPTPDARMRFVRNISCGLRLGRNIKNA